MWRVYDVQGNFILVHHFIDVKDHLQNGYIRYDRCSFEEIKKYSSSDKFKVTLKQDIEEEIVCGKERFKICKCFKTQKSKDLLKKNKTLTVIGTAKCVFDDIKRFGIHGDVAVVNDSAFYYPDYNYFVTVHGKLIPIIQKYRESFRGYFKSEYSIHSSVPKQCGLIPSDQLNADYIWEFEPLYKSSGLLAVWIGIALCYEKIIVHGVPLDLNGHFYDFTESYISNQIDNMYKNVLNNQDIINLMKENNVKFSSGRLSELIGKPL